ncbi:dhak subunit of dihydroxyacetone kinase [Pavlovales sp. CCMP2436]|nr:dhak subunit of dihydroxyacetone kinase [Pavlovales sp. CCMP2436]
MKPNENEEARPDLGKQVSKKLLNELTDAVWQMIDGLVETNCGLNRIEGHSVVVRADIDSVRDDQVAVISGSGHEPSHGGWIGPGMLSAAVAGDIFASPPAASVLAAIMTVTGVHGCLVIIKNYTGDRLHFGLACAQARAAGKKVEMVVVGEDCALPSEADAPSRRRGLAGTVLVHKVAGAAAAAGLSLEAVAAEARMAAASVGTMGLSLSTCTLPGQTAQQRIAHNHVEIGLGIHGEPGARTVHLDKVDSLVDALLEQILSDAPGHGFLSVVPGEPVCLLVNNLGATTHMELAVAARRAIEHLEARWGVRVVRVFSGTFMSSLDMAGLSLSVMKLTTLSTARLDALTRAPAWPHASGVRIAKRAPVPAVTIVTTGESAPHGRATDPATLERAIRCVCARLKACSAQLNEWDRLVGDGDCGDTLQAGAVAVLAALDLADTKSELADAASALRLVGSAAERMGGSSGALYHIGLEAAVGAAVRHASGGSSDAAMWAAALAEANRAISECGGAGVGFRTMLDALVPASSALSAAAARGESAAQCLDAAVTAAAEGAEATMQMRANAGRSAFVPEAAQMGVPDPGAVGAVEWLRGIREALAE